MGRISQKAYNKICRENLLALVEGLSAAQGHPGGAGPLRRCADRGARSDGGLVAEG